MKALSLFLTLLVVFGGMPFALAAGGGQGEAHGEKSFQIPRTVSEYEHDREAGVWQKISERAAQDPFNVVATVIFLCAILHTFAAGAITKLAHKAQHAHEERMVAAKRRAQDKPQAGAVDDVSFKAVALHYLGEVEAIFGIWLIPLAAAYVSFFGWQPFTSFIESVHYTEPVFVVVIMAISASRPVIRFAEQLMERVAKLFGGSVAAWWFTILTIGPVLGSFITEPAAMTICALLLSKKFYELEPKPKFAYATLGLLFVNISVGGTLTHFAAPPVLMVVSPWDWDMAYMFRNFGVWAVGGILIANVAYYSCFRKQFADLVDRQTGGSESGVETWEDRRDGIPLSVTIVHLVLLAWTVFNVHNVPLFMFGLLVFIAFVWATEHHQNPIKLRTPMLVGFFLAALVTHGKFQGWWIDPILSALDAVPLMIGATVLTAFNDNAAITFLATQVPGLSEIAKQAVVAGAVTGGGLTVIANAPNPAGQSILQKHFKGGVSPMGLLLGALVPTVIMGMILMIPRMLGIG
ncbi:MAG: putative Na+/H+ antiporter [Verrucomicrobiota bacterium]